MVSAVFVFELNVWPISVFTHRGRLANLRGKFRYIKIFLHNATVKDLGLVFKLKVAKMITGNSEAEANEDRFSYLGDVLGMEGGAQEAVSSRIRST